ncbi:MFS transporter [Streptomyces sp. JJ36]|uniref:MFS transporter n=1 Tax=Streptomyces sp. JJ36 TaxID=2736645 RepID=UPI001F454E9A|nr:MFS transporter [Streptomyces sp. JJ36]
MSRTSPVGASAGTSEPPQALWNRNFLLFFTARAVAKLGDAMLPVALAAGLLGHGYGAGAIGYAMAAFSVCFAGFVVFGGVFADRLDTRALMVGSDLVRVGAQGMAAGLFFTGHVVLWQICVIGAVNGLAAGTFQPGVASTVPRIARDVQGANGAIRTAESLAMLGGPAVAGMLVALASAGGVFAAHAGTYAVSALCLLLLRLGRPRPGEAGAAGRDRPRASYRADLAEGWREFRARTWMWGVIVIWMVLMITVSGPLVPLTAGEIVPTHGAGVFGLVNSALGAGTTVGGLIAMRVRPARLLRAGALALLGFGLYPAAVGLGLPLPAVMGCTAVSGAAIAFWGVMWATSVQTQVPGPILNRLHAYEVAGSLAMMPVGQALAGPAAALFGARTVLVAGGVMVLVVSAALLSVRAVRELPRADGGPVGGDTATGSPAPGAPADAGAAPPGAYARGRSEDRSRVLGRKTE